MLSDHYSLLVDLEYYKKKAYEYYIQTRTTKTGLQNFTFDIHNFNWNYVFRQNTVADMFRVFFNKLYNLYSTYFPQKYHKKYIQFSKQRRGILKT